jgi:predicted PurR-regulated permease PerM
MRRDKIIANLLFLFVIFLILYIFSPELSAFFQEMENKVDSRPLQSLFWFLTLVAKSFGNWLFSVISYMIVGGIVYLLGRRE